MGKIAKQFPPIRRCPSCGSVRLDASRWAVEAVADMLFAWCKRCGVHFAVAKRY